VPESCLETAFATLQLTCLVRNQNVVLWMREQLCWALCDGLGLRSWPCAPMRGQRNWSPSRLHVSSAHWREAGFEEYGLSRNIGWQPPQEGTLWRRRPPASLDRRF
jgi:hypothetical protein